MPDVGVGGGVFHQKIGSGMSIGGALANTVVTTTTGTPRR
jgi:hypothetical protein